MSWWREKVTSGAASGSNPAMSNVEEGAVPTPQIFQRDKSGSF